MKDIVPVDNLKYNGHSQVLINLILNYNIKVIAEVGVLKGRNMRRILRSPARKKITEYFAIDPWDVRDQERHWRRRNQESISKEYIGICSYMQWFKALRVIRLRSEETAPLFQNGYFDLVYIDADHSYPEVSRDTKIWLPKVKKGGIIGGHDYIENIEDIPILYDRKTDTPYNREYLGGVKRAVVEIFGNDFIKERCTVWYKVLDGEKNGI